MRAILLIPVALTIGLFSSTNVSADPKADISAYNKAIADGNNDLFESLLERAFEDAKNNLSPENPYLVRISYDYALNAILNDEFEKALPAAQIIRSNLKSNPTIFSGSDIDEINLVIAIAECFPLPKNGRTYRISSKLNDAINAFSAKYPNDPMLLNAYYALAIVHASGADWLEIGLSGEKLLEVFNKQDTIIKQQRSKYEVIALMFRGQAKFALGLNRAPSRRIGHFAGFEKAPYWESAYADFEKALELYGDATSKDDKEYAQVSIWRDLIIAGVTTDNLKEMNQEKIQENVRRKLNLTNETNQLNSAPRYADCSKFVKVNIDNSNFNKLAAEYKFAATSVLLDIGSDNKPSNIRILASVPKEDVAATVVASLASGNVTVAPEAPSYCIKDYRLNVRFITH